MKRVCLFNFPHVSRIGQYQIETFDPLPYFSKRPRQSLYELVTEGINGFDKRRGLRTNASMVDRLYRERDPDYMRMAGDFIDRFRDVDILIMATYNFLHPELLAKELKNPTKVLGFVDDPLSTYVRGIPYLWAFDGAFFISPSYVGAFPFEQALDQWSGKPCTWWPLVPFAFRRPAEANDAFFRNRRNDLVYVGNASGPKIDRLLALKKHFGERFLVHGRWPLRGYAGLARGLLGKPLFPYRVTSLSAAARESLYWSTKIGFNMHVSEEPNEAGNMRTYETPAHGMMMVCDRAGGDAHAKIFEPGVEAVFYSSVAESVEIIEHYLDKGDERIAIARAGYDRYWKDYEWEANLKRLLDWCDSLPKL